MIGLMALRGSQILKEFNCLKWRIASIIWLIDELKKLNELLVTLGAISPISFLRHELYAPASSIVIILSQTLVLHHLNKHEL
jgi:hypothetical protein